MFLLLVFNCFPDLFRLQLFLILLLSDYSPLLNIIAFIYFLLPELSYVGLFVVLCFPQVRRDFIEEQCPFAVISVSHALFLALVSEVLELEVGDAGETQSQTRLVALV